MVIYSCNAVRKGFCDQCCAGARILFRLRRHQLNWLIILPSSNELPVFGSRCWLKKISHPIKSGLAREHGSLWLYLQNHLFFIYYFQELPVPGISAAQSGARVLSFQPECCLFSLHHLRQSWPVVVVVPPTSCMTQFKLFCSVGSWPKFFNFQNVATCFCIIGILLFFSL